MKINIESIKDFVKKSLPFPLSKNHAYDTQTAKVINTLLNKKSNTIDIGAHRGAILQYLIRCAPQGKHYAFEPIPQCAEYLRENFSNNASIFELALSNEVGKSIFNYVVSKPQFSGLQKRPYDINEEDKKITVSVSTLDTLLSIGDIVSPIDLVKIDVEGGEFNVIKGGCEFFTKQAPTLIFEHGMTSVEMNSMVVTDIYDYLNEVCGLDVNLMSRFLRRDPPLTKELFKSKMESGEYYFMAHKTKTSY